MAIESALQEVRNSGDLPVPLHLRNAPTKLMKDMGYGQSYQYAHGFDGNFVVQEFLPDALSGKQFFDPGNNPREHEMRQNMKQKWKEKYGY
jgi:putative ATPase